MADMFGAPIGIGAAEQDMRQNVLGALQAQDMLGKIEMQPAQRRMTEAHARLYGAEADLKEAQARDQRTMQEIAQGVAAARQAATRGELLTVENQPTRPRSLAEPYVQMLAEAERRGVSPMVTEKIATQAAGILQKEAAAVNSAAQAQIHKIDMQAKAAERVGSLAQMGLAGPQQYAQARMMMAQEGIPTQELPEDFQQAVPMLQGLVDQSMKAKDKLDLSRKDLHEKAQEKLWKSSEARNYAAVKTATAREELVKERTSLLRKNGGATSPEAKAHKEELTAATKARREAAERKEFPQMPIDPAAIQLGKSYTDKQGRRITAVGKDSKGLPVFELATKIRTPLSATALTTSEEEEDFEEEED